MKLWTSRWQNLGLETSDLLAVGISRGAPRFPVRYRYRRLMELAPDGWMLGVDDDARFERAYTRKLDKIGADRIGELLRAISDEEGGADLALLCYEDTHAGQVCHRRMFAEWWEARTGQAMEELESCGPSRSSHREEQPTLFDQEGE